ncbi:MAG: class I SAM-dependent methyltransferase [Flavobacteriaceae bacterium]|nr:class I SAM-dependent methyltransferase [Flavobacteriaceae bacterium]
MEELDLKSHWNNAYDKTKTKNLGWFEETCAPSIDLINSCHLNKKSCILNVGAGTTLLIDELIALQYTNLIANDISNIALDKIKKRLGSNKKHVKFIIDNLLKPSSLNLINPVDLWHDRAVLHFFTDKEDQKAYFNLLKTKVKLGGYVIIATFNLEGAIQCSGLPVQRYNKAMISKRLGKNFNLIKCFDYTFYNPSGDSREYIYTLFKRNSM